MRYPGRLGPLRRLKSSSMLTVFGPSRSWLNSSVSHPAFFTADASGTGIGSFTRLTGDNQGLITTENRAAAG